MTPTDYFAGEHAHGTDDAGELLCTTAENLTASLGWHSNAPANCLSAAMVDITRSAATALTREHSTNLPPALPPTV